MKGIEALRVGHIVLLLAMLLWNPQASVAAVGRTNGQGSVSATGAANYAIPIGLPPGRNNLTPNVAVVYNHRNGNGLMGMGLSLAGLSTISRCNRTIAQDGAMAEPTLSTGDGFCLDGQRLRLASGSYGSPGSTYQTEIHNFARVTAVGATAGGPTSWLVHQRDGLIYEYGATSNSFIETVGSSAARLWALNRIRDRSGNYIDFTYIEDATNGGYRPNEILYTGHSLALPTTKVVFVYEAANRPDPLYAYRYGSGVVDARIQEYKRLDRIDIVYIPTAATIRTVDFTYDSAGGAGNRSRVASIRECVGGDCLASTSFQWVNGTSGWNAEVSTSQLTHGSVVLDINGDGHDDVAYSSSATAGAGTWYFMLATDTGFGAPVNTGITNASFEDARPIDWDGDPHADILVPCTGATTWCVLQSTGSGFAAPVNTTAALSGAANLTLSADVNGDSRDDLVRIITGSLPHRLGLRLRNATGFSAETIAWTAPTNDERLSYNFASELSRRNNSHLRRRDYNGDSQEDFTLRVLHDSGEPGVPDTNSFHIFYGKGSVIVDGGSFTSGNQGGLPGDFNGDGLTDLVQLVTGGCGIRFGRGMGLSAVVAGPACVGMPTVADYDADGLSDLLINNGTNWMVARSTGNGFSALINTGLPASAGELVRVADVSGDGLQDLVRTDTGNVWRYRLHAGAMPDFLDRVTDGYGLFVDFDYQPISSASACYDTNVVGSDDGSITPGARRYREAMYVVCGMSASDGVGGNYSVSHRYSSAYMDYGGRGFQGFRQKRTQDSRDNIVRFETFRLLYPYLGMLQTSWMQQPSSGPAIVSTDHNVGVHTSVFNGETRYFVYASGGREELRAVSPTHNGALMRRTDTTHTVDANSGTVTQTTVSVLESASGNGASGWNDLYHTSILRHPTLFNDFANWCIGRPTETRVTRSSDAAYGGAAVERTATTTWDGVNCRPTQTVREPGSTQYQVTTDYRYDGFGNVDQVTLQPASGQGQVNRTTSVYWGTSGRFPETITNPKSQVTTLSWDAVLGLRTGVTDPNSDTVTTSYDAFGRMLRQTRPDSTATDYVFAWCSVTTCPTADANLRTVITQIERDTANSEITSSYSYLDQFDRTTWAQSKVLSGALSTTRVIYNARGLVAQQSTPYLSMDPVWYTTTAYDLLGRPIEITRPKHEGDPAEHRTSIVYAGLRTIVTNARGYSTQQVQNAVGQVVEMIDAGSNATKYWYDGFDNLVRTRDPANNEIVLTYNNLGMKLTSADPDMGAWAYSYYPFGELRNQTDAKSQITTFTYDQLSRPLTRVEAEGTTTFGYDSGANAIGRMSSATSPGGYTESYSYDSVGRPSQTGITADSITYYYNYSYNSATGRLETMTYPTSSPGFRFKLRYSYDYGHLRAINNYVGDVLGVAYWQAQGMNARGQILLDSYANGLSTSSLYDRITGTLTWKTTGPSGGTSIQNLSYLWDESGNLTQRQDSRTSVTETFSYDALDRMYASNRNGSPLLSVGYNAIGNITSKTGVGTYTYHATKKHAVASTSGTLNNTYTYDNNGNMTSRNGLTTTWYSYNLPQTINGPSGNSSQFSYGPHRARWKHVKTTASGTGTWTYIGRHLQRLVTPNTNEFRHYIYGPSGPVLMYKRPSNGIGPMTYYLTTDHLGSTDVITNAVATEQVNISFNAFGERKAADGISTPSAADQSAYRNVTVNGFTFHEHLDEQALVHMNGRVYDPVIGRFTSADPFVNAPFFSQSFNRYSYVLNNPLSYTDPSGFREIARWDAGSGVTEGTTAPPDIDTVEVWGDPWSELPDVFQNPFGSLPSDFGQPSGGDDPQGDGPIRGDLNETIENVVTTASRRQPVRAATPSSAASSSNLPSKSACARAQELAATLASTPDAQSDTVLDPVDNALTAGGGILAGAASSTRGNLYLQMTHDAAERSALAPRQPLPTNANVFGPVARVVAPIGIGVNLGQVYLAGSEYGLEAGGRATFDSLVTIGLARLGTYGVIGALSYNAVGGSQGLQEMSQTTGSAQILEGLLMQCAMGL